MIRQLERNLGVHSENPLYTPSCSLRLQGLSQRLIGCSEPGGWVKCFSGQTGEYEVLHESGSSDLVIQRKRKSSVVILDSDDEETGQQRKRIKTDVCERECLDAGEPGAKEEMPGKLGDSPAETTPEELQPAQDTPCDALPEHIKVETKSVLST